jgi:hypothetical protein
MMKVACGVVLRRPLAVLVTIIGLTVAACANNTSTAPGTASPAPSLPVTSSTPPAPSQPTVRSWAKSLCQALGFTFLQLGTPPEPDLANPGATRQAFSTYLGDAANATQQAIGLLSSVGAPPVDDGQRILDHMRTRLTQLHGNLNNMAAQLNAANADDVGAIAQAFGAIGNVVGLFGTLTNDPQLRAAIDQTPECHISSG